ncbi:MAG TPA: glycosyltransferase family A protein [Sinorhizobium sp.]|nr:glycosyltransferase family A protein [Sinorhizobium sp.]
MITISDCAAAAMESRMSRADKHLKLFVAALTRKRPEMLAELLDSWAKAAIPVQCTVTFLVVENDATELCRDVVDQYAGRFAQSRLLYVLETELGIPFGRNRAAKEAIAADADLLVFMDDDEVAAEDWLDRLVAGYRQSNAVLLGAPLRANAPDGPLTLMQRTMYRNVEARYAQKEARAKKRASLHGTDRVTIVTNNWLAELSLFTRHGIWFDEEMRFTGGTDSKFYAQVRAKGLPTGWVADAFVYETVPPERLSFTYQYRRARDQSNTNIRRKKQSESRPAITGLALIPAKIVISMALMIGVPLTGGKTLLDLARTLGWISGRLGSLLGARSNLYKDVTGN